MVDIYNTFCKALDEGKEVRAVFLDISKAFDRVKGLLFKLKQAVINSTVLQWLSSYLSDRKRRSICSKRTRLRTPCSSLNHHLFSKNIINDPYCQYGSVETTKHYIFECQRYSQLRQEMLNEISKYCTPSLECLLFGDDHLNHSCNCDVSLAVQKFIFESERFKS